MIGIDPMFKHGELHVYEIPKRVDRHRYMRWVAEILRFESNFEFIQKDPAKKPGILWYTDTTLEIAESFNDTGRMYEGCEHDSEDPWRKHIGIYPISTCCISDDVIQDRIRNPHYPLPLTLGDLKPIEIVAVVIDNINTFRIYNKRESKEDGTYYSLRYDELRTLAKDQDVLILIAKEHWNPNAIPAEHHCLS